VCVVDVDEAVGDAVPFGGLIRAVVESEGDDGRVMGEGLLITIQWMSCRDLFLTIDLRIYALVQALGPCFHSLPCLLLNVILMTPSPYFVNTPYSLQ
jgi:hypothetical protein